MISRVFLTIFYITMCMADAETYQQTGTDINITLGNNTVNVTIGNTTYDNVTIGNISNASQCNVWMNPEDIEFDTVQGRYFYYIDGQGFYFFWINGTSSGGSKGNDDDHGRSRNGNDNDGHQRPRRHNGYSSSRNHGSKGNRPSGPVKDVFSQLFPLNFTVGNINYCLNKTRSSTDRNNDNDHSRTNDNDHSRTNDNDHSRTNDNDHSRTNDNDHSRTNDNDHSRTNDNDHGKNNDNDHSHNNVPSRSPSPVPSPVSSPIPVPVTTTGGGGDVLAPSNIQINITNGNGTVVINTTTNSSTDVNVVVPSVAALGVESKNNYQIVDTWGNDAMHVQLRNDLTNQKTDIENHLDTEIQNEGINVQRKSVLEILSQNNIMKFTSTFLFPLGSTEDAKQKTCNALADTAEYYSNLKHSRDCDYTALSNIKRQAGDYVMISTYSSDPNSGMVLSISLITIFIAVLSYSL